MGNSKDFPELDNYFVENIIQSVECQYNSEYNIFHENVNILIDSDHKIECEKLKLYSKIIHFKIILKKDLKYSENRLLCSKENTLLFHFLPGHFSKIKPKFIPDMVTFDSNVSKTQSLSGNLFPDYDYDGGKLKYKEPTICFCSFDVRC